jgi:hypothetical protein
VFKFAVTQNTATQQHDQFEERMISTQPAGGHADECEAIKTFLAESPANPIYALPIHF